jgi:beta-glucosidase
MNNMKTIPYLNPDLPVAERVRDLVGRMTTEEKIGQMLHVAPAVERLDVPAYNWWNECLHGVGRAGVATVFPQAIGLAATWNEELMERVGTAVSDEARAKHHAALKHGIRAQYLGLTFWSPNVNIFRDPRWGRGHETYGEDPYLTGRLGVGFVKGLQGRDKRYLKLVATAKHYAVHSGPESERHGFDAVVSPKDLRETYLPAFEALVREAKVEAVMGAYNRTNGEVCCGSPTLLQKILREEWGFAGHVVSDCGAVCDFHQHHKVTSRPEESAALAVRNGCDLNCGETYRFLVGAVKEGLLTEAELDRALTRLMTARFRLGMFDPPARVPFARIPVSVNDSAKHRRLARQAARESVVLLKNQGGLLPLRKDLANIAVVGPNAASFDVLLGNYNGLNPRMVTIVEGVCGKVSAQTAVNWHAGCSLAGDFKGGFGMAKAYCAPADVIVAVMGLSPKLEGEEGDASDTTAGGDRQRLELPGVQEEFLKELVAMGKPVVLVLMSGSAVAMPWAKENVPAIVQAWYPGEEGGTAVADVLFGDYNPAGRLPVTFYKGTFQLPEFRDYSMKGRTYRYFGGEPLYPFGYGLSYTSFRYSGLRVRVARDRQSAKVAVTVRNTGERAGDEVVQLYLTDLEASAPVPIRSLRGFRRVNLKPGERKTVEFVLGAADLACVLEDGRAVVEPGEFEVSVGGGQPDTEAVAEARVVQARFRAG